jgi:hypothetical protein
VPRYLTNLAGLFARPARAKDIVRLFAIGDAVELKRDPDNAYDANAIQIWAGPNADEFIGFVEKLANAPIAADLDAGLAYTATVSNVYPDNGEGGKNPEWMRPLIEIITEAPPRD